MFFVSAGNNFFALRISLRWPRRSSFAKAFSFLTEPKTWLHFPLLKTIW